MPIRDLAFAKTQVPAVRTFAEIDALLAKHGITDTRVTSRTVDDDEREYTLEFIITDARLAVRLQLIYPLDPPSRRNSAARALYWFVKAKLDGIAYGIETAEIAWAPYLLGPAGDTLADDPERIAASVGRGHVFALPRGDT
ncbi:MAG: hypothetical protein F4Y14_09870 [Acidobacteria bacterium]|nr:hypothetical protein [Acidobacteriota bacterium]